MTNIIKKSSLRLALIGIALTLIGGGALADKPDWAGGKNKEGKERHEEQERGAQGRNEDRHRAAQTISFRDDDRRAVSEYYGHPKRKGKCPPGLAKKHDGCLPPGQAKKWQKGHPLAKDIKYYELPKELRMRLPAPPPDHRYVRVAGDILMVAIGTGLVVDAIEDILR